MKKLKNKSTIVAILILFCSCEKEIDIALTNRTPQLIVEGNVLLGLDTLIQWQQIKLTRSANFVGNAVPEPITNATVNVFDGQNTFSFNHTNNGIYTSNFIAETNKVYQLTITHNGNRYEASEKMKMGPALDSLSVSFFPSALGSPEGNFITINMTDPVNERNFYLWRLFINNQLMINPSPGNIFRAVQKDDFFNGKRLINYLPYDNFPVVVGDRARMEQLNISEQMYNYYYSIFNLTASSPISGDVPPGKILGNIVNKSKPEELALGYFGACSISVKSRNL